MRNDAGKDDPKKIWQEQPTEASIMTLEKIRRKTRELHGKTRRDLLRGRIVPLLLIAISGGGIAWFDSTAVPVSFAIAIAWSVVGQYFLNRGMSSETPAADAALSTGLESYRREVERRRYLSGRYLWWSLGPVALAIAAFVAPLVSLGMRKGMLRDMTPFLILLAVWGVAVIVQGIRGQRELRQEIDELNELESANG